MRKIFTLILVAVTLQSCTNTVVPLKGNYTKSNTFYFDKSENEVWTGLMAVLCDKGFSVKSMEKSSGVIFGDKYDFSLVASAEDSKGELVAKDAYIVTKHT